MPSAAFFFSPYGTDVRLPCLMSLAFLLVFGGGDYDWLQWKTVRVPGLFAMYLRESLFFFSVKEASTKLW